MHSEAPLSGRAREVLHAIVRAYIETGEPVGSRTLSRERHDRLSPASIRNVMADLADDGYLSQPHTSAGRVPTAKAFRHYVRTLSAGRMASSEAARFRVELGGARTFEDRVERSTHLLTELTQNVGIVAAFPNAGQELDQIELLPLADRRVLMILVTSNGIVHNRVVALDEPLSGQELESIRNYINVNFHGWSLGAARRELLRRIEEERAACDAVLRKLTLLYQKGLLEVDTAPEVFMDGASNLFGIDLHLTREKMRDLLRALEEKQRIMDLLDRFLAQSAGEIEVRVGLEEAHPAMKELALIGICLNMPNGLSAKIAVLGHMRMQYERTMGTVLHLGHVFQSLPF